MGLTLPAPFGGPIVLRQTTGGVRSWVDAAVVLCSRPTPGIAQPVELLRSEGARRPTIANMRLRLASPAEREVLEALQRRASFANTEDREALLLASSNAVLPIGHIEFGWVVLAEDSGCPSGFAVIVPGTEGVVELDGLFVDPHLWRRGVGRMLVEHCTTIAKQLGGRSLEVVANRHALGFYESCGFQQSGTVRTEFGTGVAMTLALE